MLIPAKSMITKTGFFFKLYDSKHDMHYYKEIGYVNEHVQGLPNFRCKIMQPEIMTGNRHEKKDE